MNNLAGTATLLGDLQAARELHEHVLADRRRVLGGDHPDTLTAMNNLAAARNRLVPPTEDGVTRPSAASTSQLAGLAAVRAKSVDRRGELAPADDRA